MTDARVVSNEFVNAAWEDENNTLTPMQVLKLVYIAHGWKLGLIRTPLIGNRIEAWKFGPVIPDLYHAIKDYRDTPVGSIDVKRYDKLSDSDEQFVRSIYQIYREETGISLSNLTHATGTPWHQVFKPNESNILISNDIIQEHYRALAED